MRLTKGEGKQAERSLRGAGYTKADTARVGKTSYRMAKYWYDGEKSSPKLLEAHKVLTGQDLRAERDERRRKPVHAA